MNSLKTPQYGHSCCHFINKRNQDPPKLIGFLVQKDLNPGLSDSKAPIHFRKEGEAAGEGDLLYPKHCARQVPLYHLLPLLQGRYS